MYQAQAHAFAFRSCIGLCSCSALTFGLLVSHRLVFLFMLRYCTGSRFRLRAMHWFRPFFRLKLRLKLVLILLPFSYASPHALVHTQIRAQASIEQGYEPGHKLDIDMTRKQTMIIKHEFEPEHDPEPLQGQKAKA